MNKFYIADAIAYAVMCAMNNNQSFHATQLWQHLQEYMQENNIEESKIRNYNNARKAIME